MVNYCFRSGFPKLFGSQTPSMNPIFLDPHSYFGLIFASWNNNIKRKINVKISRLVRLTPPSHWFRAFSYLDPLELLALVTWKCDSENQIADHMLCYSVLFSQSDA